MADESKGPEGWEAEDYEREKIRELREQGLDPGSIQQKLRDLGHPSARSHGTHPTEGEVQKPVSGEGNPNARAPGGEEREMIARDGSAGGGSRDENRAHDEDE